MKELSNNQLQQINGGLLENMAEQYGDFCQQATEAGQFIWDFVDEHPSQAALVGVGLYVGFQVVAGVASMVNRFAFPRNVAGGGLSL